MAQGTDHLDIDTAWDFADAAGSEGRFAAMLAQAEHAGDGGRVAEVRTQLARAQGLQRKFADAHVTLDGVESWLAANEATATWEDVRIRVRLELERGRVLNSSGDQAGARPRFVRAWEQASSPVSRPTFDGLAVDAAHMIATVGTPQDAVEWNTRAIAFAERSSNPDARRWRASLLNNMGWTAFAAGDLATAMGYLERALAARIENGTEGKGRGPWLVARWCVARTRRALGSIDTALAEQMRLRDEHASAGTEDGFVEEEIGECLLTLGRAEEAREHFAAAHAELSRDVWLVEREAGRIERLRSLAG